MVTQKSGKTVASNPTNSKAKEDTEGVWSAILNDIVSVDSTKLPGSKQLLLLGDAHTGKTTLVAKLQGNEDPKKGAGLEYTHILVRDEYRDATTRLSVWTLDGDAEHAHLLQFAVDERRLADTLVVLTVAMTTPWLIMDQLQSWATIIQDHIDQLNESTDTVRQRQALVQRRWQQYVEPGDDAETAAAATTAPASADNTGITGSSHSPILPSSSSAAAALSGSASNNGSQDGFSGEVLLPLGENVLARNMGVELVVVVTKTDYMSVLEKDYDYKDEHFDFIQQYVRKFCLQYGAALFYTSVKEDKNCDLLYKYLVHRIYGFPFKTPALVVEKDAVFIPAGWDNEKKIAILYEGMHSIHPDTYYTEIIARPVIRKTAVRDAEVTAEEEQVFLARMQQQALTGPAAAAAGGAGGASVAAGAAAAAGLQSSPAAAAGAKQDRAVTAAGAAAAAAAAGGAGGVLGVIQKTPERRMVSLPALGGSLSSGKKMDAVKPGAGVTSEGVLANFFNSLLNKKTGSPGGPGSVASSPGSLSTTAIGSPLNKSLPGDSELTRSDAAAELERLSRAKKHSATTGDSSDC